jgi:hypothetical protein
MVAVSMIIIFIIVDVGDFMSFAQLIKMRWFKVSLRL